MRSPSDDGAMITKLADVPDLVKGGRTRPEVAFPRIRRLAASEHWQEREVAATALVEIGKRCRTGAGS